MLLNCPNPFSFTNPRSFSTYTNGYLNKQRRSQLLHDIKSREHRIWAQDILRSDNRLPWKKLNKIFN